MYHIAKSKALNLILPFSHSWILLAYRPSTPNWRGKSIRKSSIVLSNWIDQTTTLQIIAFLWLAETTMWNNMVRHGALNIIKLVPCTFDYIILFNCVSNVVTAHTVHRTIVHSTQHPTMGFHRFRYSNFNKWICCLCYWYP